MSVLNLDFTFNADTEGKVCNVPVSAQYMFYGVGTFGNGCLTLEASPDNGVTWFTVEQLTAPGRLIRYLVSGEKVRIVLTNSASANISAGIRQ